MIGDRTDANLEIDAHDLGLRGAPPARRAGRVYQPFGGELPKVIEALNKELAA